MIQIVGKWVYYRIRFLLSHARKSAGVSLQQRVEFLWKIQRYTMRLKDRSRLGLRKGLDPGAGWPSRNGAASWCARWQVGCPCLQPMREAEKGHPDLFRYSSLHSRGQPRLNDDLLLLIPNTFWRTALSPNNRDQLGSQNTNPACWKPGLWKGPASSKRASSECLSCQTRQMVNIALLPECFSCFTMN